MGWTRVKAVVMEVFWGLWLFGWGLHYWLRAGGEHGVWVLTQGFIFLAGMHVGSWLEARIAVRSRQQPRPEPTLFKLWQGGSEAAHVLLVERARERSVETTIEEAPRAQHSR